MKRYPPVSITTVPSTHDGLANDIATAWARDQCWVCEGDEPDGVQYVRLEPVGTSGHAPQPITKVAPRCSCQASMDHDDITHRPTGSFAPSQSGPQITFMPLAELVKSFNIKPPSDLAQGPTPPAESRQPKPAPWALEGPQGAELPACRPCGTIHMEHAPCPGISLDLVMLFDRTSTPIKLRWHDGHQ